VAQVLDTQIVAVVAACLVLWGLLSARLERVDLTAPLGFAALGLVVAHEPLALIHVDVRSSTIESLAEITLALVLFVDASRVNVHALRLDASLPIRLLGVGLPLAVAGGTVAAAAIYGGINLWVAAAIGAVVAPTDAALAAPILHNDRVPSRVRRLLNVESGLNDGLTAPLVALFLAGAATDEALHTGGIGHAALQLLVGGAVGAAAGGLGATLLRTSQRRGWSGAGFRPLVVLGLALFAYAASIEASGNGFVAAFIAGMTFGSTHPTDDDATVGFTDETGAFLSLVVWFVFGALLPIGLEHAGWSDLLFAVVALSVVRMGAVAIALIGAGLDRMTVAFVGWFGPRGLASVIFGVIAVDSLRPADGNRVLAATTLTVALSIVAHGLSGSPLSRKYGEHMARVHPGGPEHEPRPHLRTRTLASSRGARASGGDDGA
jgi:NhaP-type Na+/H+ or K+/H+ antiporter